MFKKEGSGLVAGNRWDAMVDWGIDALESMRLQPHAPVPSILTAGRFSAACINPDGSIAWTSPFKNGTTLVGLTNILSTYLGAGTQTTAWYMGLISNTGFGGLSSSDTMSSHATWTEAVEYTSGTRPVWTPSAAASQAITNTTSVDFTMSSPPAEGIAGALLVSVATKGGSTGILWATGAFSSAQVLITGQVLKVTYTATASAS